MDSRARAVRGFVKRVAGRRNGAATRTARVVSERNVPVPERGGLRVVHARQRRRWNGEADRWGGQLGRWNVLSVR